MCIILEGEQVHGANLPLWSQVNSSSLLMINPVIYYPLSTLVLVRGDKDYSDHQYPTDTPGF